MEADLSSLTQKIQQLSADIALLKAQQQKGPTQIKIGRAHV